MIRFTQAHFKILAFNAISLLIAVSANASIPRKQIAHARLASAEEVSESSGVVEAVDNNQAQLIANWLKAGHSPFAKIKNRLHEKILDRAAMAGSNAVFLVLLKSVQQHDAHAVLTDYRGTPLIVGLTSRAVDGQKLAPVFEQMVEEYLQVFPSAANERDHAYIGDGRTALHQAAANGDVRLIKALIAHGALVNAKNSTGETPLHLAARFGHIDAIRYLVAVGARIDEKTTYTKATPLMSAAEMGQASAIRQLIASGAKKDAKDIFGKTAPERYKEYAGNFYNKIQVSPSAPSKKKLN
jgi:hypothetical protein